MSFFSFFFCFFMQAVSLSSVEDKVPNSVSLLWAASQISVQFFQPQLNCQRFGQSYTQNLGLPLSSFLLFWYFSSSYSSGCSCPLNPVFWLFKQLKLWVFHQFQLSLEVEAKCFINRKLTRFLSLLPSIIPPPISTCFYLLFSANKQLFYICFSRVDSFYQSQEGQSDKSYLAQWKQNASASLFIV